MRKQDRHGGLWRPRRIPRAVRAAVLLVPPLAAPARFLSTASSCGCLEAKLCTATRVVSEDEVVPAGEPLSVKLQFAPKRQKGPESVHLRFEETGGGEAVRQLDLTYTVDGLESHFNGLFWTNIIQSDSGTGYVNVGAGVTAGAPCIGGGLGLAAQLGTLHTGQLNNTTNPCAPVPSLPCTSDGVKSCNTAALKTWLCQ